MDGARMTKQNSTDQSIPAETRRQPHFLWLFVAYRGLLGRGAPQARPSGGPVPVPPRRLGCAVPLHSAGNFAPFCAAVRRIVRGGRRTLLSFSSATRLHPPWLTFFPCATRSRIRPRPRAAPSLIRCRLSLKLVQLPPPFSESFNPPPGGPAQIPPPTTTPSGAFQAPPARPSLTFSPPACSASPRCTLPLPYSVPPAASADTQELTDMHSDFPLRFIPQSTDFGDWPQVEAQYRRLDERPIDRPAELQQWIEDVSELESAVSEEDQSRYIAMTCQTDDAQRERRYLDFL